MLDPCTKIVVQHFITDKLIHVMKDIPDDEIESNKENMFREDRDAESDQANINGSDSDYADESVMDVVIDVVVVGGEDKHKARAVCDNYICMLLMLLHDHSTGFIHIHFIRSCYL